MLVPEVQITLFGTMGNITKLCASDELTHVSLLLCRARCLTGIMGMFDSCLVTASFFGNRFLHALLLLRCSQGEVFDITRFIALHPGGGKLEPCKVYTCLTFCS